LAYIQSDTYNIKSNGSARVFNPALPAHLAERIRANFIASAPGPRKRKWSKERASRVLDTMVRAGRSDTWSYALDDIDTSGNTALIASVIIGKLSVTRAARQLSGRRRDRLAEARARAFRRLSPEQQEQLLALV